MIPYKYYFSNICAKRAPTSLHQGPTLVQPTFPPKKSALGTDSPVLLSLFTCCFVAVYV